MRCTTFRSCCFWSCISCLILMASSLRRARSRSLSSFNLSISLAFSNFSSFNRSASLTFSSRNRSNSLAFSSCSCLLLACSRSFLIFFFPSSRIFSIAALAAGFESIFASCDGVERSAFLFGPRLEEGESVGAESAFLRLLLRVEGEEKESRVL